MRIVLTSLFVFALAGPSVAADPAAVEFFEAKVRPVLAEHCYSCHGPKKQNAGLRLDTAEGFRKGSDAGPAVVPGDPAKSRLIQSVKRQGDYPMPPKTPLPAEAVAALTEWVKQGAVYPGTGAHTEKAPNFADHWAFKAVTDPAVPKAKSNAANPIDQFVLAKLEAKGLSLAAAATKETLIRRAHFDLIGIPPTYDEVQAFVKDTAPGAYERLIDRLLASPHFGERWGRHWLDLARYADSKGYVFTEDRTYPYAYTYRDYVIRSFNDDKPYNQFVVEQLAADRLPKGADNKKLAALGFLTVGRRFMNNVHDIIDDRIDVVTRGLMGLTVSCARCHDHKYDPIPTADYYSLYGVFSANSEPKDLPIIGDANSAEVKAFEAEVKSKQDAVNAFAAKMYGDALAKFRTPEAVATYLIAARDTRTMNETLPDKLAADRKLDANMLGRWREYLAADARKKDPIFAPWLAAWTVPNAQFAERGVKAIQDALVKPDVPTALASALREANPQTASELAAVYGRVLSDAIKPLAKDEKPDAERAKLAAVLSAPDAPTNPVDPMLADKFVAIAVKKEYRLLRNAVDKLKSTSPLAPPKAMVLEERANAPQPVIFLRGNARNAGPTVPRQMPAIIAGPNRKPFASGSGRLEMANAIASPKNPLTARVYANRVWGHLIGQPLVNTPSDFGVRSDPPTHPELLDWLATRFVEDGWSTKKLIRRVVLSNAYTQSSEVSAKSLAVDPENRLLTHMNRKRFDFEALRDGLLHASNKLDPTVYGRSVDLFAKPFTTRRTVYGFVDRQNLAGTFRTFDFASPDQHTPQRFLTTVPQQALFLMNNPFVAEQAKAVVARPDVAFAFGPEDRIGRIYQAVLARTPTTEEVAMAKEFVQGVPSVDGPKLSSWTLLAQVLLLSNEFAFVD